MKRAPLIPTIVVLLAVAIMVRLGVWQLHRLGEKEGLLARFAANANKPVVPISSFPAIDESVLYRRVTASCPDVANWKVEAGRTRSGMVGWRHIAFCGQGFAVDVGTSQNAVPPSWKGGDVTGYLTWAPSAQPLAYRIVGTADPQSPMVVSETAAAGLEPTAPPDPSTIPNNHLSYAIQWFFFAATALVIYAILLWRRARVAPRSPRR